MPPRSSWKGFIKLSLVSVPVKAYTATVTSSEIRLNQLHRDCHNRVQYKKTCPEHGEIPNDEIVSGYEYSKGNYVVVDPDEVDKLRSENDRSIQIDGFLPPAEIDPIYFAGRTYYLAPDGPVGQKPYGLLRTVMEEQGLYAIAKTVVAGREQVVLLRPAGRTLAMTVLTYPAKIKTPSSFEDEIQSLEFAPDELKLTRTLIEASTIDAFDFSEYQDVYVQKMSQLIAAKVEGQELVSVPDPEEPKIINLMDALKQSVANAQSAQSARKAGGNKKMAPSAKARKPAAGKKKSG
ncbi:MAG: Ku protein [Planctomycetota bacterium]